MQVAADICVLTLCHWNISVALCLLILSQHQVQHLSLTGLADTFATLVLSCHSFTLLTITFKAFNSAPCSTKGLQELRVSLNGRNHNCNIGAGLHVQWQIHHNSSMRAQSTDLLQALKNKGMVVLEKSSAAEGQGCPACLCAAEVITFIKLAGPIKARSIISHSWHRAVAAPLCLCACPGVCIGDGIIVGACPFWRPYLSVSSSKKSHVGECKYGYSSAGWPNSGCIYWVRPFCLPRAFSTAGEGVSTKLRTLPTSPLPRATRNMVPQVAGTRYSSAGWPMCVIAFAANAIPRPPI